MPAPVESIKSVSDISLAFPGNPKPGRDRRESATVITDTFWHFEVTVRAHFSTVETTKDAIRGFSDSNESNYESFVGGTKVRCSGIGIRLGAGHRNAEPAVRFLCYEEDP